MCGMPVNPVISLFTLTNKVESIPQLNLTTPNYYNLIIAMSYSVVCIVVYISISLLHLTSTPFQFNDNNMSNIDIIDSNYVLPFPIHTPTIYL